MTRIAVLGGGAWGTVLAHLLASQGHPVIWWVYEKEIEESVRLRRTNDLYFPDHKIGDGVEVTRDGAKLGGAEIVFFVVPSEFARKTLRALKSSFPPGVPLISCGKGIETSPFKRMSEVLTEELPAHRLAVLSGPTLAMEVARGDPAGAVIASADASLALRVQQVFADTNLRLYPSADVIGVEIAGSLKNVMAIASGTAAGFGFGSNTQAALLARALAEMKRAGAHFGAGRETFNGLAGLGDLAATCFSPLSRNYQTGFRLAKGETLDAIRASMKSVAEGVPTARAYHHLAESAGLDLPITTEVYRVLYEGKSPKNAAATLMARPLKPRE